MNILMRSAMGRSVVVVATPTAFAGTSTVVACATRFTEGTDADEDPPPPPPPPPLRLEGGLTGWTFSMVTPYEVTGPRDALVGAPRDTENVSSLSLAESDDIVADMTAEV